MPADGRTQGQGNNRRRDPLDDLLTGRELLAESRNTTATSAAQKRRVKRHIFRTIPASVFAMAGLLLVAIGVLIGEHVAQNKIEQVPVVNPSSAISHEELPKSANEPRHDLRKTFATPDAGVTDQDNDLPAHDAQRLNDGVDVADAPGTEVIKRRVMRPVSPPPNIQNVPPLRAFQI